MSSELKANKISPATGTALTLADSGDTLTLPSGATLDIASGATIANSGTATGFGTSAVVAVALSGNQSLTKNAVTKVQFAYEVADTQGWWDSSTNYRFTPTVAGYYFCNLHCFFAGQSAANTRFLYIYKNGSSYRDHRQYFSTAYDRYDAISDVVYLNGSSDYIEFYAMDGSNGTLTLQQTSASYGTAYSGTFASIFKVD